MMSRASRILVLGMAVVRAERAMTAVEIETSIVNDNAKVVRALQ